MGLKFQFLPPIGSSFKTIDEGLGFSDNEIRRVAMSKKEKQFKPDTRLVALLVLAVILFIILISV